MSVQEVGEEVFINGASAAIGPELQQILQTLDPNGIAERGLVARQSAQDAQRMDTGKNAVFCGALPDVGVSQAGLAQHFVLDQICRTSGKRFLRQLILHRFPEEDWRMKEYRFIAGKIP